MKSILFLSICLFGLILAGDETITKPTLTSLSPPTIEAVETVKVIKREPIVTRSTSTGTREKVVATGDAENKGSPGDPADKEEKDQKKDKLAPDEDKDKLSPVEDKDNDQIADTSTDTNEHDEQSIEAEIPDHGGDTKIVQNNYNIPGVGWHRFTSSEAFTLVSGLLLIIILLLGITVLAIVLVKLVHNGDNPGKPMLVPPPMGVHWRNDLDYSLGGQFGGPPPPPDHAFSDQPLHHPPKKVL